jgi:hypothetical protein
MTQAKPISIPFQQCANLRVGLISNHRNINICRDTQTATTVRQLKSGALPVALRVHESSARWLASHEFSVASSLGVLCHFQRVIHLDTQITNRTFDSMDFST